MNYQKHEAYIRKISKPECNIGKRLNLGCGKQKIDGWVNADISGADINFNFDKFPYPFDDNTFDYIYSGGTLEHLGDLIKVFNELHRICKNNAVIEIKSPFWLHPTNSCIDDKHYSITADWLRPIVDNMSGNDTRYRPIKGKFDLIRYEYLTEFKFRFVPKFLINKFANLIPCLVLFVKHYVLVKKNG